MTDDASARLSLPYLAAGQLQKHVTLNETLTRLDALVQSAAVSRSIVPQPTAPADGSLYVLPESASGAVWSGRSAGDLMRFEAGGWVPVPVATGTIVWIEDEATFVIRDGGGWASIGERLSAVQGLSRFGLNTTADTANPFAARLNKALWTAVNAGDGGDGDLRLTFNKESAADVLSLLFQSGYGGRLELGLIGGDDLTIKVSPDGSTWRVAMTVDRTSGAAIFPSGCGRVEVSIVTSGATWTVPAWARRIKAVAVGGGGGGGSGAAGASGAARFGGGGGGAGGACAAAWATSDLAPSLTIAVGTAGAGAAVSSGVGVAGGGLDAANVPRSGGSGGTGGYVTTPAGGGGGGGASGGGAPGSGGGAASTPTRSWAGGGGGGGAASTTSGHAGGVGAAGAGGGGGGAGVTASGAGGTAGAGLVRLTAIG
jgi:hypothetical protein